MFENLRFNECNLNLIRVYLSSYLYYLSIPIIIFDFNLLLSYYNLKANYGYSSTMCALKRGRTISDQLFVYRWIYRFIVYSLWCLKQLVRYHPTSFRGTLCRWFVCLSSESLSVCLSTESLSESVYWVSACMSVYQVHICISVF